MSRKSAFAAVLLGLALTLAACGSVGSVAPQSGAQTAHPSCKTPQIPVCGDK